MKTAARFMRHTDLRPKRWGVKPVPKKASWRDEFLPDWMLATDKPRRTLYELALAAFVRQLPCCACGRLPTKDSPSEASHVTLSADQKGMGAKVPHTQVVPHCPGPNGCHAQWDQRRGLCAGWTKDERYAKAAEWVRLVSEAATPGDDFDSALALAEMGLGRIEVKADGSWAWVPACLEAA